MVKCMLKRDIHLFMRCLIPAAVLTMVFAMVCAAAAFAAVKGAEETFSPVKTAVVDQENSMFSRLVVNAAADMDMIAGMIEVISCDLDSAMEGLREGEYASVILLPEGMIDGILTGQPTKGRIYLSSAVAAQADVVAGIAAYGEVMMAAGQYGIFSGERLIWAEGMQEQFHQDFLAKYNMLLLSEALKAGSAYFEISVTDYADTNMSAVGYYALCYLTLLMALVSIFFSGLYTGDMKKPTLCRLRGLHIRDGAFLLWKLLLPAGFILLMAAGLLAGVSGVTRLHISGISLACLVSAALLAALYGGAMIMLGSAGVPAVVAFSGAGLLLCGGIIPRQLLPSVCLKIGSLTPFGVVQNLLLPVFGGRMTLLPTVAGMGYAVLLAVCVKRHLARLRIGGDAV